MVAGDDTLGGGAGADTIDGGTGSDTASFSGSKADYTISESGGTVTVTDDKSSDGDDGTDTLTNIQTLYFEAENQSYAAPAGTPANTAPTATYMDAAQTTSEDAVALDLTDIVITDPDSGDTYENPSGRRYRGALYVATDLGLFKSINAGGSWRALALTGDIAALDVAVGEPAAITVVDARGRVYRSLDGGVTWPESE